MYNISEGKFDKYRFKAIFLIGIPASGKTEFYNFALRHKNLKHIDSDKVMMFLIKKYGGNPADTSNYTKWQSNVRSKLDMMSKMYKEGGLGLVIDGTGKNLNQTLKIKKDIESYGYETALVYLKTPLADAIERSKKRDRAVDIKYLKDTYRDLTTNVFKYKEVFSPFIEINNRDKYKDAEKELNRWLNK